MGVIAIVWIIALVVIAAVFIGGLALIRRSGRSAQNPTLQSQRTAYRGLVALGVVWIVMFVFESLAFGELRWLYLGAGLWGILGGAYLVHKLPKTPPEVRRTME